MAELSEKPETILVVDDTPAVLNLVVGILKEANFNVLTATCGHDALEVAATHPGPIHLLLSDVRMARMNGAELGETLQKTRRDIRIMFMTGSLDGSLLVLNYGWAMIEKPFVAEKLLEMINVVLHSPNRSQGTHQYEAPEDTRTPE